MLAGVDDDLTPDDLGRRRVDAVIRGDILGELGFAADQAQHEDRDATGAVDLVAQFEQAVGLGRAPAPEGAVTDLVPEPALGERPAATAWLVGVHPPVPQMDDLAERRDTGKLPQKALQQRRPAAPQPSNKDHRLSVRHVHDPRSGYGTC
ncbi:hypothetical protein Hesp01_67580 [Herbidospora sp. NBRC 101105]|nr:hypothetical protein Hesp01_67580 [Herbidospora sp. NBRC 101105]